MDPKAELLEMSSPYVYSLNSPVIYVDRDGQLPILINGRVMSDDQRADSKYWTEEVINTIKNSGLPNPGGEFHYVDGDRYLPYADRFLINNLKPEPMDGLFVKGNDPHLREAAGYRAAKMDFSSMMDKLERDPKSHKIIGKIQIYTHSRGAAFGGGYIEGLLEMIKEHAEEFADPDNVIQFALNMAPHQSWGAKSSSKVEGYTMHHDKDSGSGNDMEGILGAFSSNIGKSLLEAHSVSSFNKELKAFISSYKKEGSNSKNLINDFVNRMQRDYGIKVTVNSQ